MSRKPKVPGQWWDRSWTLVHGCGWPDTWNGRVRHMPPACDHCWAKSMAKRFYPDMLKGLSLRSDRLDLPLSIQQPQVWACQINYGDLFDGRVPDSFIAEAFNTMLGECSGAPAPRHVYVLLTKRPDRAAHFVTHLDEMDFDGDGPDEAVNWANAQMIGTGPIWLVASAWDQESAREAAGLFAPLDVKWGLHLEPLLGPVDLSVDAMPELYYNDLFDGSPVLRNLSWVAAGGENGPGARPMDLVWARSVRDWCKRESVAFWFKGPGQRGEHPEDLAIYEAPWKARMENAD